MQVPKRKTGKYAHLKPDALMTREKFNKLKEDLEKLKKIKRPKLIEEVKRLALMGDFSENAAYQIAKGRLRGVNQRILDIEDLIKRAEIIKTDQDNDTVKIGHSVTVDDGSETKTYKILGGSETNPSLGIISYNSPLGASLLDKRVGDIMERKMRGKTIKFKIVKIQ